VSLNKNKYTDLHYDFKSVGADGFYRYENGHNIPLVKG
jgi:hypothetical protein